MRIGDALKRILHSTIDLPNYQCNWCGTEEKEILRPKFDWEGANLPTSTFNIGGLTKQEHALRDPYLFEECGEVYVIYEGGGESSLGIAKLFQYFGLNFNKAFHKKCDVSFLLTKPLVVFDHAPLTAKMN